MNDLVWCIIYIMYSGKSSMISAMRNEDDAISCMIQLGLRQTSSTNMLGVLLNFEIDVL